MKRVEIHLESDLTNLKGVNGWCMDPFNPNLQVDLIKPLFLDNIKEYFLGYYLEVNHPTF
jgi:hypothetical protein